MLLTFLGFPWAIALWAPIALVRLSPPSHLCLLPSTHQRGARQLAEAIHTTPDTVVGDPDIDDNQSILLADTSTHHLSQQNEELFAVEGSDSDEEAAAAASGEHEHEDSDDGNDHDGDRRGLMRNDLARRSWADLADLGENPNLQNGRGGRPPGRRGNLSSKAGLILVRPSPLVPSLAF